MNRSFWRGKKVFITGHTGFKGSWLSLWLQHLGAQVIGYALDPPTKPSMYEVGRVGEGMISIHGDVRAPESLQSAFEKWQPDMVFHLAAQALVKQSYRDPVETYSTNVLGTVNVLEAVRHCQSVRAAVCITSDKCYENKEWVWGYRESDRLGGRDPYSSSKACAELVVRAMRESFFSASSSLNREVSIASTRAGNVIGGGDWAKDRLIPDCIQALSEDKPVLIRNPQSTRPWQHVLVPLHGYLLLAERLCEEGSPYAQSWNFGPNEDDVKPVKILVEYLVEHWGKGARWELDPKSHAHEDNLLKLDCSKAKVSLGWSPKLPLLGALDWIIEWYQAYQKGQNLRQLSIEQIVRYEAMM